MEERRRPKQAANTCRVLEINHHRPLRLECKHPRTMLVSLPPSRSRLCRRSSDFATASLIFRGINGLECEHFISAVRKHAFAEGRYDDFGWTAAFAATCFVGDALRWHAELDFQIQADWRFLQQAMFKQYPPPETRRCVSTPRSI